MKPAAQCAGASCVYMQEEVARGRAGAAGPEATGAPRSAGAYYMLRCAGTPPPPPLGCCAAATASPVLLLLRESGGPSNCRNRSRSRAFSSRNSSSCSTSAAETDLSPASRSTWQQLIVQCAAPLQQWRRHQSSAGRQQAQYRQAHLCTQPVRVLPGGAHVVALSQEGIQRPLLPPLSITHRSHLQGGATGHVYVPHRSQPARQ